VRDDLLIQAVKGRVDDALRRENSPSLSAAAGQAPQSRRTLRVYEGRTRTGWEIRDSKPAFPPAGMRVFADERFAPETPRNRAVA
jgi:hypothetical protein